tara:strand:- start:277 stop:675 length:399 start_codon:yes stop_codon:yes gene_type:complete
MKFDHIGIFVREIDLGIEELNSFLNIVSESEVFHDNNLKVSVKFLYDESKICYELVAPFGEGNPVENVLSSGKNILNHLAYKSSNFDEDLEKLRNKGALPITIPQPALAFEGSRVVFLLSPLRFIIELIEDN